MHQHRPNPTTIAYVHPRRFHFVAKDIEALGRQVRVKEHRFSSGGAWLLPWDLLRQLGFLLGCKVRGVRDVIAHFAGYHTVLPVFLGFRTHIIIAGSDACAFPGIHYGSFRKPLMRAAMSYSMRGACNLLPVHASLERFANHFSTFGPVQQGYAHFVHGRIAPSTAVPYGFDLDFWSSSANAPDPRTVVCVATGVAPGNAVHYRKGVDLLIEAAALLPDHRFTIIGAEDPNAYRDLPINLRMLGKCTPDQLRQELAAHGIYAQPSVMEGFPNALCEAMLMGCLPVVSSITSMPDIIHDTGQVIHERTARQLANAIGALSALPHDERMRSRRAAQERIRPFTVERRIARLLDLIPKAWT